MKEIEITLVSCFSNSACGGQTGWLGLLLFSAD